MRRARGGPGADLFTTEQIAQIRHDYQFTDDTLAALALRYGCSQPTISAIVQGLPRQRARRQQEAAQLYDSGLSLRETADRIGVNVMTISHWLEKLGIKRRSRGGPNNPNGRRKQDGSI